MIEQAMKKGLVMTDKELLGKVRAEIERRKKEVIDNIFELGNSESERIGLFDRKEIYDDLLSFINSMEKEPKFKVGDKVRYKYNNICTKTRMIAEICGLSHYVDTDNHRMDMAYTDANFELVEEPKGCMYSKDNYTDEDRKVLCDGCEEECKLKTSKAL